MSTLSIAGEPPAAAQPEQPEGGRSFARRALDVFVSPEKAFVDLGPKAPWIAAFALYMVVPLLLGLAVPRMIPLEVRAAHLHEQMLASGAAEVPTLAELEVNMEEAEAQAPPVLPMLIGTATHAAYPAIVATICLLVFTFGLGGEARWRQYFSVVVHVLLINVVFSTLVTAFVVATRRLDFNLQLHNLFPFVPQDTAVFRILATHSVADLWMIAVLAAGVVQVNRKGTWTSRFGILLGLQLAAILLISFTIRLLTGNLPGMSGAGG